jgi:hypothetical protein
MNADKISSGGHHPADNGPMYEDFVSKHSEATVLNRDVVGSVT